MRKILFYNHTRQVSGAERVLLNLLAVLDRSEYEAVVACPTEGPGELDRLITDPILPVPILRARFTANPVRLAGYLQSTAEAVRAFRKTVRTAAPDLLHANSVRAGLVATIATMGMRVRVLWHVHDDLPPHPISSVIRAIARMSRRTQLVAVSKSTALAFAGRLNFGARLHVLPNAIDTSRFPPKTSPLDAEAQAFRDELKLLPDDFLCVCVGMLNPRKGQLQLLEGFAFAAGQSSRLHLAIVGAPIFNDDHLYEAELHRRAKALHLEHRVHFTGPRADIPAILRAADLLAHYPTVEPFGLVILEAISSGTPVIAASVGGIPEIVTDAAAWLVPADRPELLAAQLLVIAASSELRAVIAHRASADVLPRFTPGTFATHLDVLYESLFSFSSGAEESASVPAPKIAVFHDNFCQMGGAERVAEELHRALSTHAPTALHSTLSAHEILTPYLQQANIRNTWMQILPARAKLFRAYFLLYPFAIDGVDLTQYDVVVSSCFGYAKGIRRREGAVHICYCHTPMRWVWRTEDYLSRERNSGLKTALLALPLRWLKRWETRAATRPDFYIANSQVVSARLKQAFGVDATVIHPPIDTARFAPPRSVQPGHEDDLPEDFYIVLSRLVPYKRFDLAILACIALNRTLIVIGDGPDRGRLEALAAGHANIRFLGRVSDEVVADHARRTRALLSPGEEDFGMTPLEINAAGRPVVAFRGGGATETIIEDLNGIFFDEATPESLADAIVRLESASWNSAAIRAHADRFSVVNFHQRILEFFNRPTRASRTLPVPRR